ncbi:hypothetical protein F4803DRAFT_500056 [Xylaria telfairii]|nr:hypothetical protein F4803DRAFT_500056 [Xylaria telfairii]
MVGTDGSGDSNGDISVRSRKRQDEVSGLLTDSLYDGPLDHIIRNHPKLFAKPQNWTEDHCQFLHVACKDEPPVLCSSTQHHRPTERQDHEGPTRHVDKANSNSQVFDRISRHAFFITDTDADRLRVPPFQFPSLPRPHLNAHITMLRTEISNGYPPSREAALQNLLVWTPPVPSKIWKILLNPDYIDRQVSKPPNYGGGSDADNVHHRLMAENIRLCIPKYGRGYDADNVHHKLRAEGIRLYIKYGGRSRNMILSCPLYQFETGPFCTPRDDWRLIYIDCAQLKRNRGLSKKRKRHQMMRARLGLPVDTSPRVETNEGEQDGWPLSQGYMASIFIAMAQKREEDLMFRHFLVLPSRVPTPSSPQLQPRYQVLLTDNNSDCSCIHLYTASVSDFLLEHFRTPSRLPRVRHAPPLLKIHHTTIAFFPFISFRGRLRMAIMEYANGTAGGFFSDSNDGK